MCKLPLISIIIPIYNTSALLPRCLESVQNQTYSNLQILLIDDGSTDDSLTICKTYAKKDDRIEVFHQKNAGLSCARNTGTQNARGEFICFVDSDDAIYPDMLETLYQCITRDHTKIAMCGIAGTKNIIPDKVCSASDMFSLMYDPEGWQVCVAWNKLYDRRLNLHFPEHKIHEDEFVFARIMIEAEEISCTSAQKYIYTMDREGSIMKSVNADFYIHQFEAYAVRYRQFLPDFAEFAEKTKQVYFSNILRYWKDKQIREIITKDGWKSIFQHYRKMKKTKKEKLKWVVFSLLSHF